MMDISLEGDHFGKEMSVGPSAAFEKMAAPIRIGPLYNQLDCVLSPNTQG